jgi:hypothetical protein
MMISDYCNDICDDIVISIFLVLLFLSSISFSHTFLLFVFSLLVAHITVRFVCKRCDYCGEEIKESVMSSALPLLPSEIVTTISDGSGTAQTTAMGLILLVNNF